jgi:hypothetical protein
VQALAELVDEATVGLDALSREGSFEVGHEGCAERAIGFGALDDLAERRPRARELLRRTHPTLGRGAQEAEEAADPLFVVGTRHLIPRPVERLVSSLHFAQDRNPLAPDSGRANP